MLKATMCKLDVAGTDTVGIKVLDNLYQCCWWTSRWHLGLTHNLQEAKWSVLLCVQEPD